MQNTSYIPTPPAFSPPGTSPAFNRPSPAPRAQLPLPVPPRSNRAQSTISQAKSGIALSLDDPIVEARKTVGLLVGTGGDGGLLGQLQAEIERVYSRWEHAYENGSESAASLETLNALVQQLLTTLQNSPVGGFPLPTSASTNLTLQQRIESARAVPPRLHAERMRIKEGVDIAGGVLGSA
ncbi:hypothetical protein BCR35DRAFT_356537 [Leucosporidium creatinivorum]|uniref:Uncharacterized protein n=1 Tax=Leucosporidium creatinivorum TaxID=106004 RepID=A0A1Y2BSS5_9BASI|nr:hypothetical protein BCR35DRAFT_356537 [Leucosporidium creatinivorum]